MTTYTPEMDARLLRYRAVGMSHRQIAAAMATTKQSVGGRLRILATKGRVEREEAKAIFWTPEKLDALRELWTTRPDLTRRQIGQILGCTIDAVIGQLNKMDVPRRKKAVPIIETLTVTDDDADIIWQPVENPVHLPMRRPSQCCYPLWSGQPTHLYCDGTQVAGLSYCEAHCSVVFATDHWRARAA